MCRMPLMRFFPRHCSTVAICSLIHETMRLKAIYTAISAIATSRKPVMIVTSLARYLTRQRRERTPHGRGACGGVQSRGPFVHCKFLIRIAIERDVDVRKLVALNQPVHIL